MLLHARRAVVVINDIAAYYWQGLARFLATRLKHTEHAGLSIVCAAGVHARISLVFLHFGMAV